MASIRWALLAVCLAACGGATANSAPPAPSPDLGEASPCTQDAECVATNFGGCCGCPRDPYAITTAALKKHENQCAVVDCTMATSCEGFEEAKLFRAVCRGGKCALEKK